MATGKWPSAPGGSLSGWLALLVALPVAAGVLYWLLVMTEGAYLGRRVVVWLYDRAAPRYDAIKEFDPDWEHAFLARPLLRSLAGRPAPRILDVAAGTGRLPALLLGEMAFHGRVVAVEPSAQMLAIARQKVAAYGDRAGLVRGVAAPLPFGNGGFDAVCCLEALEFFPSEKAALREMVRVLRPGGVLLLTRRAGREARAFPGRFRTREGVAAQLRELALVDVKIEAWQVDYDLVWARKPRAGQAVKEAKCYGSNWAHRRGANPD